MLNISLYPIQQTSRQSCENVFTIHTIATNIHTVKKTNVEQNGAESGCFLKHANVSGGRQHFRRWVGRRLLSGGGGPSCHTGRSRTMQWSARPRTSRKSTTRGEVRQQGDSDPVAGGDGGVNRLVPPAGLDKPDHISF
jgi:hypothetical protein